MIKIKKLTFNPFQENMYLIYNEFNETIIVDPGCYTADEQIALESFISDNKLNPQRLLNTHCHIDHVLGNPFVNRKYNLLPEFHSLEQWLLDSVATYGQLWGINSEIQPHAKSYLTTDDCIKLGDDFLEIRFTPGHSPGSLVFIHHESKSILAGDVLFFESIGRTDLPGGNHSDLLNSINEQLFTLPDDYIVYPGHGPNTTIGHEKQFNPFL